MNDDKKVGRPKKSLDEKGIRTSAMLSPPYRKMIDELCKERECSISEIIELCVHKYALTQVRDDGDLVDMYIDKNMYIENFKNALTPKFSQQFMDQDRLAAGMISAVKRALKSNSLAVKPLDFEILQEVDFMSAKELEEMALSVFYGKVSSYGISARTYLLTIYQEIKNIGLITKFQIDRLIPAIYEQWKIDTPLEECVEIIKYVVDSSSCNCSNIK